MVSYRSFEPRPLGLLRGWLRSTEAALKSNLPLSKSEIGLTSVIAVPR
jgi:hypothetical protein